MDDELRQRGEPVSFDRKSGERPDSGSGAGGRAPGEDPGADRPRPPLRNAGMGGKGHPLPGSGEARHDEIPEHLEREKGRGDDSAMVVQPGEKAVNPDGEAYPYQDVECGPETGDGAAAGQGEDDVTHRDRRGSAAASEADER